jgi:2-polyprenyl-6-methoxyphenol hydroxylase-like FAD-dependent oxidoreductase
MKKLIVAGGAITGATAAAILAKRKASSGGVDFGRMVERMPENAPPKWVFRNVTAIRENTERILQLLESERTSAEG